MNSLMKNCLIVDSSLKLICNYRAVIQLLIIRRLLIGKINKYDYNQQHLSILDMPLKIALTVLQNPRIFNTLEQLCGLSADMSCADLRDLA